MKEPLDTFVKTRYRQESEQWGQYITESGVAAHAESWLRTDTVDYWHHTRVYACLDPQIKSMIAQRDRLCEEGMNQHSYSLMACESSRQRPKELLSRLCNEPAITRSCCRKDRT